MMHKDGSHGQIKERLRGYALSVGFDLFAVTSAEPFAEAEHVLVERIESGLLRGLEWFTTARARFCADPSNHLPAARSIISLGVSYLADEPNPLIPFSPVRRTSPAREGGDDGRILRGRVARFAWGRDYHEEIAGRLRLVADWLVENAPLGVRPRVFVDHGRMIDRAAAQRAGLGWYGNNTNILTRSHGSWVFLAEVLTDLEIEPDAPLRTTCGTCRRCLDACPTGALVAPGVLDNDRCISYLTIERRDWIPRELRPLAGDWIFGCDVCQSVCPVNLKARPSDHPEYDAGNGLGPAPELLPLLELDEQVFQARFRGTPIRRAKRRGLVRNAAVALGNLGDPQAVRPLVKLLADPDPIVRGHAAWALGRIGGDESRAALPHRIDVETDPLVREELSRALDRWPE